MSEIQDEAYTEACEEIERLKVRMVGLKKLCARSADALEEEFGNPLDPAYGVKGPIHDLITELRKAAE